MTVGGRKWQGVASIASLVFISALGACGGGTSSPPSTTKSVSYLGLVIEVPKAWLVVERQTHPCGISAPGVLVGPPPDQRRLNIDCPAIVSFRTVMTFGGPDPQMPVGVETEKKFHGITALVSTDRAGSYATSSIWQLVVRFPGRTAWVGGVAVGNTAQSALKEAERVVASVHSS